MIQAVFVSLALACLASDPPRSSGAADARDFDRVIAPILIRNCLECHSGPEPKGKLDLTSRGKAMEGGASGAVIVPGKPGESLLWDYVDGDEMPPKKRLGAAEKALIREWIAAGAPWGTDPIDAFRVTTARRAGLDWWSLQPVVRPDPPLVRRGEWAENPVDAFVLVGLEAKGLSPAPPAGRRTLIRRLSFDLLGLPPDPEEVEAFVHDKRPDAYEHVVNRYLASPHYGIRWARPWLDLARYGESNGFEFDEFRPNAWPYRDWVVAALNRDLPYDAFAQLQLAGDVLQPDDPGAIAATGFLVAGAYDSVGQTQQSEAMKRVVRQDELEDIVGTVGQAFLGLTVHCARCHDHKFDPIRQVEYYRLAAALAGVRHGERDLPTMAAAQPGTTQLKGYAVVSRPPEPTHRLIRGSPAQPGERVAAGGVAALRGLDPDFGLAPDAPEAKRRARLAGWVTDRRNPLFARVIVNRLWQVHFGTGLVEMPSDLGFNGGRPSHPALLDWLAAELVARSWSLKQIHHLIVTSATYRQSSRSNPAAARIDAGNRLLWRRAPMRLEAEMVRDGMLAVCGALNTRMGGPGFHDFVVTKAPGTPANLYTPIAAIGPEFDRRTLYRTWARGGRSGFLDAFDCPDPSTTAPRRASTTTPLQALALLNNALSLRLADRFAERLRREVSANLGPQIERAYLLAFGRAPETEELDEARRILVGQGPAVLARAIFNSNEYLYVD
jgi:hypothetical protein